MKFDSYPRFLKSDVYRQSLVAEMEGGALSCEEGEEERGMKGRGFFWKVLIKIMFSFSVNSCACFIGSRQYSKCYLVPQISGSNEIVASPYLCNKFKQMDNSSGLCVKANSSTYYL